jgi:hypothetical protein
MAYECKVFDENEKLIKILKKSQVAKESKEFFNQSSTKYFLSKIDRFKDPAVEENKNTKFCNKNYAVCKRKFHPRYHN